MAKPFVKWVGGKRRVADEIISKLPERIGLYCEPFVGGGAVFFALEAQGRLRESEVLLADANLDLICAYRAIRDQVDDVVAALESTVLWHSPEYFATLRALDPSSLSPPQRTARFMYINRVGFNGLMRYNRQGGCNTPWGKRARVSYDYVNLRAASKALRRVVLLQRDFRGVYCEAEADWVLYADPPYIGTFSGYTAGGFSREDFEDLLNAHKRAIELGAASVISNSAATIAMLEGLPVHHMHEYNAVNRDGAGRGAYPTLLITGLTG